MVSVERVRPPLLGPMHTGHHHGAADDRVAWTAVFTVQGAVVTVDARVDVLAGRPLVHNVAVGTTRRPGTGRGGGGRRNLAHSSPG